MRIQKDNLKLTRVNLERAHIRQSIGVTGPEEVYRWESEIANAKKAVLEAQAQHARAKYYLNQLLHRAQNEPFVTLETGLSDLKLFLLEDKFHKFVDNPKDFNLLTEFLIKEAKSASPELGELNAVLAVTKRRITAAKRSYWVPNLNIQGNMDRRLAKGGVGSDIPAGMQETDDTEWNIALNASLPIFRGGMRSAENKQAGEELKQLTFERGAVCDQIELRLRDALSRVSVSKPGIQLSKDAAAAAKKNLDLLTDAYARGVVSIIRLLDAQNTSLTAEQASLNAMYDYLTDNIEVERAVGKYGLTMSLKEKDEMFARMTGFYNQADK
jgi:outer membrane protein TolC